MAARFDQANAVKHQDQDVGYVLRENGRVWKKTGWQPDILIASAHGIIMRVPDGQVLWQKDPDAIHSQPSTTKVMTVHIALKVLGPAWDYSTRLTLTESHKNAGGSGNNLLVGDTLTIDDAFLNIMRPSSNITCEMVAEYVGKIILANQSASFSAARAAFIAEMNAEAARLGMTGTTYTSTNGFVNMSTNVSTVRDLCLAAREAINSAHFRLTWSAASAVIDVGGPNARLQTVQTLSNTTFNDPRVMGSKNGSTSVGGPWLVTHASLEDGTEVLIGLARAPDADARYIETPRLITISPMLL